MWFMNDHIKKYYYLAILQNFYKISTRQRSFHSAVDERLYLIYILYRNKYVNMILHSHLHLFDYSKIV